MDQTAVDVALLVFRCAIGAVMFAHGWNHLFRGGKVTGTAGWFESLGMRPGIVHAWLASLAELAAGVSLPVGLATPLGAAAVVGTMTVAFITNRRAVALMGGDRNERPLVARSQRIALGHAG